MKKSLIALAVLAAAGSAYAQSSVTLFGVVDATLAFGRGSLSNKTQLTNSGYNSSRLGFRGVEDLGGGMSASFWLELGLNNDNGTGFGTNTNNQASGGAAPAAGGQGLTFNRRSTVSLSSGFGEMRLGRDYTPQFWNLTIFDPFGTLGVGSTQTLNSIITGPTAVRASNSIGYFLPPNIGGFYGQAAYYLGENNSNNCTAVGVPVGCSGAFSHDGKGYGFRVGYAAGPVNVAGAFSRTQYAAGTVHQNNIGGQYDFGVAKLQAHVSRDRNGAIGTGRGWLIGGLFPIGAGEIRAAYSRYHTDVAGPIDPTTKKFALGYVHNLSKRTALYTTWARVKSSGYAAAAVSPTLNGAFGTGGASSTGYDFGIRHAF